MSDAGGHDPARQSVLLVAAQTRSTSSFLDEEATADERSYVDV